MKTFSILCFSLLLFHNLHSQDICSREDIECTYKKQSIPHLVIKKKGLENKKVFYLLHGITQSSLQWTKINCQWCFGKATLSILEKGYQVVLLDAPGHGFRHNSIDSDLLLQKLWSNDISHFFDLSEQYAHDLKILINQSVLKPKSIGGFSLGAASLLAYLSLFDDFFESVHLFGIPTNIPVGNKKTNDHFFTWNKNIKNNKFGKLNVYHANKDIFSSLSSLNQLMDQHTDYKVFTFEEDHDLSNIFNYFRPPW